MTRDEQLIFCKNCTNSKLDFKIGLICVLTNQKANFENKCLNFNPTDNYKKEIEDNKPQIRIETKWECNKCNEINEDSFELCWNCQKSRDEFDKVIKKKIVLASQKQIAFKKDEEVGSTRRMLINGFLLYFMSYGFFILTKSFFNWPTSYAGKLLPDEPEIMFIFLILYNLLYLFEYFTYKRKIRKTLGIEHFIKGIIVNTILIVFYIVGVNIF